MILDDLQHAPQARALAELASAAAFVDGGLLRTLRRSFLPDADARAEADVWSSEIVDYRGSNGLTFSGLALDELRAALSRREDVGEVVAAVARHHEGGPPLLLLEERLIASDLLGDNGEIDACLETAIAELDRERADEVLAWAARSLPRFPRRARASSAAWVLALAVQSRFRVPLVFDPETPPSTLDWERLARWLPDRTLDVAVQIGAEHNDVIATEVRSEGAISLPATDPLVLLIERRGAQNIVVLPRGGQSRLGSTRNPLTITSLRGDRWSVEARPSGTFAD